MSSTKDTHEIEVDITLDQINDLDFLQKKFLTVSFQLLKELSDHSEREFIELVNEFIPDEESITDEFLSDWGITKQELDFKTKKKLNNDTKQIKPKKKESEVEGSEVEEPKVEGSEVEEPKVEGSEVEESKSKTKDVVAKSAKPKKRIKIKKKKKSNTGVQVNTTPVLEVKKTKKTKQPKK